MDAIKAIRDDYFLLLFLLILILLTIAVPSNPSRYYEFVEWKTIAALTGLLVITTGIKESGYLHNTALKILSKVRSERYLALLLAVMSVGLSMFLTNDVALLIIVPLTLSLQQLLNNNIKKMIIFEAIAVNVGSALTPIGNPQNLFLWHYSKVSFLLFIYRMMLQELNVFGVFLIYVSRKMDSLLLCSFI